MGAFSDSLTNLIQEISRVSADKVETLVCGYPRFKNRNHYISFTYPQVDNAKITFSKQGYEGKQKRRLVHKNRAGI